jgi:hypothetical protein
MYGSVLAPIDDDRPDDLVRSISELVGVLGDGVKLSDPAAVVEQAETALGAAAVTGAAWFDATLEDLVAEPVEDLRSSVRRRSLLCALNRDPNISGTRAVESCRARFEQSFYVTSSRVLLFGDSPLGGRR